MFSRKYLFLTGHELNTKTYLALRLQNKRILGKRRTLTTDCQDKLYILFELDFPTTKTMSASITTL